MHRITTMNLGACVGYTGTLATHRLSISNGNHNMLNRYNGKTFFDDKNYRWIIKCLDDGYHISTDLIEYMQDYCDLLQDISHRFSTYSNKWKSKLKHQSSLSSYHTTKRAQLQTVRSPEKLVPLIQSRCNAIQQVIVSYKKQIERMYPSERFGTVHKHYRSIEMERLFKNAYSFLRKVLDKLEKLREQEKKAQDALRDAEIQCQNLELNETTIKSKSSRVNDHQKKTQRELQAVKAKIARTEEECNQERETYRKKATEIYQQCRDIEQERLDQICQTLIQFIQAIHTSEYSTELDTIYEDLLSNIVSEQDTLKDLDFWAQTYHVTILTKSSSSETNQNDDDSDDDENTESRTTTQKTKKSYKTETANLTTIDENTDQSTVETDEAQSLANKTTTTAKSKTKKKKNSTTEPTTPDTTGLSQV